MACAWVAKELLRQVYAAPNLEAAKKRLEAFHAWAEQVQVPEVDGLSRTLRTWEEETLNYHRTGATNGPTEAVNLIRLFANGWGVGDLPGGIGIHQK